MFSSNATQVSSANYIEDVFSTYLYTGNGSTTTINNGIDVSGDGGLVWVKARANGNRSHTLFDSATYTTGQYYLATNITNGFLDTGVTGTFALNNNGFSVSGTSAQWNASGESFASWTFRKQAKFFDVVTYTGTGSNTTISHSLGSVPACIMVKRTDTTGDWQVYHSSLANTEYLVLNTTAAKATGATRWNSTTPTSTVFSIGTDATVNASGGTYVAYLFAHDAGGFGLTGSDNVISCGSYTGNGSNTNGTNVDLGYEPQWLLIKKSSSGTSDWLMVDNMRGMTADGTDEQLKANSSGAADSTTAVIVKSTGFQLKATGNPNTSGETYIYIAIRRGPMKVPTSGTSVFEPVAQTNSGSQPFPVTAGFPVDSAWFGQRNGWGVNFITSDRLRGATNLLLTTSTNDEATNNSTYGPSTSKLDSNTQFKDGMTSASEPDIYWMFKRAPSFFDEVCYTGTGSATTFTHNLGVAPELMIVKRRSTAGNNWCVYSSSLTATNRVFLNTTDATSAQTSMWNDTEPTSTVFTVGTNATTNASGSTYVAYLFATCAGVSKVGSYTGTGTTKQIDCGFTGGARFVLIKRTDSTGDWYVWDTARGIVSGNDPYLLLNSTAAEVTNTDYVDTYSAGFEISSTAPAAINANGGTFIFLAIA